VCTNRQCPPPTTVSFCVQVGDICQHDNQCCTGVCNLVTATNGICAQITTQSCNPDGELCNGCGSCCSHFCGPYGPSNTDICQPASGCRVQGDLCHVNSDCCGGDPSNGLPGAGQVVCTPDPTYPTKIGTCSGPNVSNCPPANADAGTPGCSGGTCDPAGNICHFTGTAICQGGTTNVRNDCCACISTKTCCKPDAVGIPRCFLTTTCKAEGEICSFNGDCCGGVPCIPDSTGQLRCGAPGCNADAGPCCQAEGMVCTTNSDCCVGLPCTVPAGSLKGTCGLPVLPPSDMAQPPQPDLAGVDLAGADLSQPPAPDMAQPPICAVVGQSCLSAPCCPSPGVQCLNSLGATCSGGDTTCTCFLPIP
jgi:hypothetical protein